MIDAMFPSQLFFSTFAHRIEKDGVQAYYHALRLKPVYFTAEMASTIEQLRSCSDTKEFFSSITDKTIQDQMVDAINALMANKVLVKNPDADTKVMSHFQSSIPQPYVQIAYFILTENCNFGCSYCFVKRDGQNRQGAKNMTLDTALKGLDFFCRQIAKDKKRFSEEKNIIFYGGEPLLNTKILKFILEKVQQYKSDGRLPEQTRLSIITNGSLLSQQNIDLLTENNVSIGISLDGDECATDTCRSYTNGSPVYKDVIKGIDRCKQNDVPFSLSVTLTEQSVREFDKTLEELQSIGCKALGFNILLTDENFKVADGYNEAAADCIIKGFETFRKAGVYEDRMMRKVKAFAESKVYFFDCGAAGGGQIVIAPDGEVGICHGFLGSREFFPTTVDDESFDPVSDATFADWGRRTPLNMVECQSCMAIGICGGGCPLNALKNQGSIWGMDERFCVHSKKSLNWLVWDLFEKVNSAPN
jgi:uncharacterized protein